jgi:hypothetical protein
MALAAKTSTVDFDILNDAAIAKVEQKITSKTDDILAGYMTQIEQDRKAASEIRDPVKRAQALNLLNTRFKDVRSKMETDKTDMSDVVLAFAEYAKQLDMEVEDLFKETPEQAARKATAANRVSVARLEMSVAPTRTTFFGARDPVASAKTELEQAEAALIEINAAVAREITKKARNSNTEESLARLLTYGERAFTALVEGHRIMIARTEAIRKDKEHSFQVAKDSKAKISELDLQITDLESQRDTAKDVLDHASEDDANYVELKENVSNLEAKLQTASADRSAHLLVSREEQINAQEYTGYERSAIAMTGDSKALAAAQQVKNRNIAQKRAHYIETMEQLKKIEMSATALKTGNEVDRRLLDTMLEAGAASTNARQEVQKDQPERLDYARRRLDEQDEAMLHAAGVDEATRKDFAERFLGSKAAATPSA